MRAIDLADPAAHVGPPAAHLLKPAAIVLVVMPLCLSAGLQRAWSQADSLAVDVGQQVSTLETQAVAAAAERTRVERLQAMIDGAGRLQSVTSDILARLPAVTAHLQPGTRLSELLIDADGLRITGSARAPADVSLWLGRSSGRDPRMVWGAPEIRDASAGEGRVGFALRIRRVAQVLGTAGP